MMTLQEKLEQSNTFYFFASENIEKGPDLGGLGFSDAEVGREAFKEILEATEKGFVRVSFYLFDNNIRLVINDLKNRHIVTVNNLSINSEDLESLKSAHKNHQELPIAFGVLPSTRTPNICPITKDVIVLMIKSWELVIF
ncbi:hypothetical protein [Sphingobacterium siyangense]|uniref:Uncharacterized protein n=1 Tax=Sphingobacterium siyangense TaxID=459529 RepID=A0A562MH53_9SPHI|nr:hypothetical protein [Sphingobacterium siyangense]TWI19158.1 hypothetical protein IQ31_02904 [Sphingobacterium siyangense]